jgi:hypothetical protein
VSPNGCASGSSTAIFLDLRVQICFPYSKYGAIGNQKHIGDNLYIRSVGNRFGLGNTSRIIIIGLAVTGSLITSQVRGAWTPPGSDVIFANYDPNFGGDPVGISSQPTSGPNYHAGSSNERDAVTFTTDGNAYELDSVSLDLTCFLGKSSDLIVSLYSDSGGVPGTDLGTFSNPASITQGPQLFTASGIVLDPATTYWIMAAPSLLETSDFEWWHTIDAVGQENISYLDPTGSFWEPADSMTSSAQPSLSVYGTPVPEPSILALAGLGAVALMLFRRRK